MKKIGEIWERVRWFCSTQAMNAYMGMGLEILSLIMLFPQIGFIAGVILSPFVALLLYFTVNFLYREPKEVFASPTLKQDILGLIFGFCYVLLFVILA